MAFKTAPHPGRWTAARISGLYALLAGLWVYASDRLIDLLTGQAPEFFALQTYKGWLFVGVTAPLLYGLISTALKPSRREKDTADGDTADNGIAGDIPAPWNGALTPLTIFLLLAAAIGALGYFSYAYQKQILQAGKQAELTAIADTKVRQIADWLNERRGDALVLSGDPFLVQAVQNCLRGGPAAASGSVDQARLAERLTRFQAIYDYRSVALLSASGETLVCAGELPEDAHLKQQIEQVLRSDELTVFDLHRNGPAEPIEMTLMAPLKWSDGQAEQTLGVVYLRIDPQRYLFPLVQTWPLPSATAETLLVRAEGTEVVYLNELRHRSDTALNLRLPLSAPHLPAAMAVRGQEGIVQGVDYRQAPVLAALRAISGTPWHLVAKVDIDEIYAPIRAVALLVAVLAGLLIATAGIGVVLWWGQQRALFTAEHYRNALERKALVRHFDYLARYANDIVLLTDEQGRIIEANERALEAYGFSREELRQRPIQDLHEPDHQARITAQLALIESSGGLIYETLHQRRDGGTFPVEVSARGMVIDNKRFFQHIIRDVSERKQLLKHTEQQARILDAILAATPDQIWMRDRAGRYLYVNAAALRAVGRPRAEDVIGKTWSELGLPATLMEPLAAQVQQVFATGRPATHEITVPTAADVRHYEYTLSAIPGEGDGLYAVVNTVRDITERVRAEQSLRESELRFRTFMDNNPAIAFIKDQQGRYQYGNRAWMAQFSQPSARLLGKTDADLFPAPTYQEFLRSDELVRSQGEIIERVESGSDEEGQPRWWTVIKFPLPGPNGQRLIGGLALDITEQRRAEEQVKQRQTELAHMNRVSTLGEMASGMAHELNQPLTAITNYCDAALTMLRSDPMHGTERLGYALEKASVQALRAGEIVRHLRDFVRKDTAGRQRLDMNTLVRESVEFITAEARFQAVTTAFCLTEPLPEVDGDRIQLQQVLVNLLHNAIEAMEQATSPVRRLTVGTALTADRRIQVSVQDTGPGLAPGIAERLFQRFQTTKTSGIGLGLPISRSIIEAHGGRLWAEPSVPGQGAVFHFTLPVVAEE